MCGITGFFHRNTGSYTVGIEILKKMTSLLHHQGPDEAGLYIDDTAGLGQARLSIIDLAGGIKPIHDKNFLKNVGIFNHRKVAMLLTKIRSGRTSGETDGMVFAGILSTHIFYKQFLLDSIEPQKTCSFSIIEDHRTGMKG